MIEDFDIAKQSEILGLPVVVLYKHSHRCGVSARARTAVEEFVRAHPDVNLYQIDVVAQRELSNHIADTFSVRHESPQILLLKDGEVVCHRSHWQINSKELSEVILTAQAQEEE